MPTIGRRTLLLAGASATLAPGSARAEPYPNRPIRIVVPFAAGAGVLDIMARLIGRHMALGLGQQVVIDNRPGAGGIVGADMVAKAEPDGYTLLMGNTALVVSPYLYAKLPFNPRTDFVPLGMVNSAPLLLVVNPSVPVQSVQEFIAYAKVRPGQLNYGSGGVGATPYLATELFKSTTGIEAVHVPYKGGAPALADLVAGQLTFMIENVPGTMPLVKSGKLRALAITSAQRSPLAPDLPTIAQSGVPGYEMVGWNGLFVAKGTPDDLVARLASELARVLHLAEVKEQMATLGAEPGNDTPQSFAAFAAAEQTRWGKIIEERGIRPE
ncbi:MAG: tripartite tricarboxylate transporter substrate binding protein [Reyranellaceae bacterium]